MKFTICKLLIFIQWRLSKSFLIIFNAISIEVVHVVICEFVLQFENYPWSILFEFRSVWLLFDPFPVDLGSLFV